MSIYPTLMTKALKEDGGSNIIVVNLQLNPASKGAHMPIIQCHKGHRYDSVKFKECPFCKSAAEEVHKEEKVDSQDLFASSIGLLESTIDRVPVVGWIVCVKGPERGRDFRIKSGRNSIGRSWKMDISIAKDEALMQAGHAHIIYSTQDGSFRLVSGDGVDILRNGEPVTQETSLEENDRIRLGVSEFVFVPYCKKGRQWEP